MLRCAASSLHPRFMPLWAGQPLAYPTVQKTGTAAALWPRPSAAGRDILPKAHARGSGGSTCCGEWAPALLSGLADQHVVGNRSGAGADAEESIERRMPCAAPVEAEYELVQVVLKICPSQAVVNTQAPALEI